jgi:relaxase/mobilization nuclease family protein
MVELGYEIKHGKHIAFKPKDKQRFTRAKTIGEDYAEERLKERITENKSIKAPPVKK